MSTPSQLPRTKIRLSQERADQLDALALESNISFAKLVGSAVAAVLQADAMGDALRAYQAPAARPVGRMFRLGPALKVAISDAAWANRVSVSVALDAALAFTLSKVEGHDYSAWLQSAASQA